LTSTSLTATKNQTVHLDQERSRHLAKGAPSERPAKFQTEYNATPGYEARTESHLGAESSSSNKVAQETSRLTARHMSRCRLIGTRALRHDARSWPM
jgi:hypothetical protein